MIGIIHISDLHLCEPVPTMPFVRSFEFLAESVSEVAKCRLSECNNSFLAISGDIGWKGNENIYPRALNFIQLLKDKLSINDKFIILCPGNHDLCQEEPKFKSYNNIVYKLTGSLDQILNNDRTVFLLRKSKLEFIGFNSTFHLDYTYGLIDEESLKKVALTKGKGVAILHHNLIGVNNKKKSTVRNAYLFFIWAFENEMRCILHGHQHMKQCLYFGSRPTYMIGCGSLTSPGGKIPSQFNIIQINDTTLKCYRYLFLPDEQSKGSLGSWKEIKVI